MFHLGAVIRRVVEVVEVLNGLGLRPEELGVANNV